MYGTIATRGYHLFVPTEKFDFDQGARIQNGFRYRIFIPGQNPNADEPLIRLQSDKRGHPNNAHFPPNYMRAHFQEKDWPEWLRSPDIFKAYKLFEMIVKENGLLPEPFRSA